MKNLYYIIALFAMIISFNSCDNNGDIEAWRDANVNAYKEIAKNPDYKALTTETGPTGVYYKVIKTGTGTEHPLQTSKVKVLYKVYYYDKSIFGAGTGTSDIPVTMGVYEEIYSGVYTPRGLSFAFQNMVAGDKWEIWIPYYLAFGAYGIQDFDYYYYQSQTVIKGYTTLVYEVELVEVVMYP